MKTRQHETQVCPDCGVQPGQPHADRCDVQRCSVCGTQRIRCQCGGHDPQKSAWAGDWPYARILTLSRDQAVRELLAEFEDHLLCGEDADLPWWWEKITGDSAEWVEDERGGHLVIQEA